MIMMQHLLWFLLAFPLVRVFPAPIPQAPTASIVPKPGDSVGVRPGAYEEKTRAVQVTMPYPLSDTQQVELEESQYSPWSCFIHGKWTTPFCEDIEEPP